MMRAMHKSKRVSWPPDFKLCQVKLFMSEDSPSQVGSESQDHLQAKSSHPTDDNLPPGFGGPLSDIESQIKLSDIPVIKWKCAVRFLLDEEWRVVAGEETEEVEAQNQRELRVLEAFYPGASAIPQNPAVTADVENSHYDDQQTVVIPILPIDDDDTADPASDKPNQLSADVTTEPSVTNENTSTPLTVPGPDIMAVLSAIANSKEQGSSMIDQDLLIKILRNPTLVQNLAANCGATSVSSSASSLAPQSHEANGVVTTTPASSNGQFYSQPMVNHNPPMVYPPAPSDQPNYGAPPPPARDASYYKNLIQQHGEERQETPPVQHLGYRYNVQPGGPNPEMINSNNGNNQRPRDSKPKMMKPCMYFNSSRGCRNGANCLYQHDASAYQPRNLNNGNINSYETQNAKRMRFDRD